MRAMLMLEDGTMWLGQAVGATGEVHGEVVFNTSMTGYQEMLTDPACAGQIITMTYPLIGNCGAYNLDAEGAKAYARGFVVHELADYPSNWRAKSTLDAFLAECHIVGISGIDTRALTRILRSRGTMKGAIATGDVDPAELLARINAAPDINSEDLVAAVTTDRPYVFHPGTGEHVVVIDLGSKASVARCLAERNCKVTVVPAYTDAADIMAMGPAGILISDGPGDPLNAKPAITAVSALLGQVTIFGVGLGHQILGLALGAKRYKLKYGHRGANHPVQDTVTGRVTITAQNHGYALSDELLPRDVLVSHRNLNDGTIEGIVHTAMAAFSVQFHPEAAGGPHERGYLFDRFLAALRGQTYFGAQAS